MRTSSKNLACLASVCCLMVGSADQSWMFGAAADFNSLASSSQTITIESIDPLPPSCLIFSSVDQARRRISISGTNLAPSGTGAYYANITGQSLSGIGRTNTQSFSSTPQYDPETGTLYVDMTSDWSGISARFTIRVRYGASDPPVVVWSNWSPIFYMTETEQECAIFAALNSATATPPSTLTPTGTAMPTSTRTPTPTYTLTSTQTPSATPTANATATPSSTATVGVATSTPDSAVSTQSATPTPEMPSTPTQTPVNGPAFQGTIYLPILHQSAKGATPIFNNVEVEPNNYVNEANGPLSIGREGSARANDERDYFKFSILRNSSITITLDGPGNLQLLLFESSMRLIQHNGGLENKVQVNSVLAAGQYFILVYAETPSDKAYVIQLDE